jgi:hypothetical protein
MPPEFAENWAYRKPASSTAAVRQIEATAKEERLEKIKVLDTRQAEMKVQRRDRHGRITWAASGVTTSDKAILSQLRPNPGEGEEFGFRAAEAFADVAAQNLDLLLGRLSHGGPKAFGSQQWSAALESVAKVLDSMGFEWLLIGSAALAVRGVPLQPRDIDLCLLGTKEQAIALCEAMRPHLICPMRDLGDLLGARWFSRAWLVVAIEWLAVPDRAVDELFSRRGLACEFGNAAVEDADTVRWNNLLLRVPPLRIHLQVAKDRGLGERAALIEAWMPQRGERSCC